MPNKELGIADPVYDALRIRSGQSIAPDLGGGSFGTGGVENKIYVWHSDGSTIDTFDPDAAGLALALAAAASGDTVWLPSMTIALTAGITIPAGVVIQGSNGSASILSFSGFSGTGVTLSSGSVLVQLNISYNGTGQATARAILATADTWGIGLCSAYAHSATTNIAIECTGSSAGLRGYIDKSSLQAAFGTNARAIVVGAGGCVTIRDCTARARDAATINQALNNAASSSGNEIIVENSRFDSDQDAIYSTGYMLLLLCSTNGVAAGINNQAGAVARVFAVRWSSLSNAGSVIYLDGDRLANSQAASAANAMADYASTNISNPPMPLEFDSAFGLANVRGPGFLGVINDNGDDLSIYLAASTGYHWYYMNLTKAAFTSALILAFLASDSYTGANGTHLNVHTMDTGGGWTENVGSWTINSNTAVQGTSTGSGVIYIATTETSQANIHLTVKVKTSYASGSGAAGIIARFSDTSNYWMIYCNWAGGTVAIQEINAGVSTQRAFKSWVNQYQKSVQIDVNLSGNTIAATFDGGYGLSYTSTFNNTATKHGIAEVRETGTPYQANSFDDFQAISLAANPWTRQGTIMAGGEPTVLYDSNPVILTADNVFKMWLITGAVAATVHYAESTDGITWTLYGSNPVLSGVVRARVTKYDEVYYLYASYNDTRIDLYTSTNGVAWTLDTAGVLNLGTAGAWDDGNVANTFVWQDAPNDWHMLYEARSGSSPYHIGYATSADGRAWTKSGSNPVISEEGSTGRPFVKKVGTYYYLWCHRASAGNLPLYLVRYRSQNLTAWTRWPEAVIIPRVGAGEGEDTYVGQAGDMTIMEYNGQAYLYFVVIDDGTGAGPSYLNLATANLAAIYDY